MKKSIFILLCIVILISGCSFNKKTDKTDMKDISNQVINFITTGEKSELFDKNIKIDKLDKIDINTEIIVNNIYKFDNSIYIQINNLMYRFQLNNKNIIESYVKYELEA